MAETLILAASGCFARNQWRTEHEGDMGTGGQTFLQATGREQNSNLRDERPP
jgi:hypothetical protein